MRHRKGGHHLSRTSVHRKAMLQNMVVSLFEHELVKTTLPKAKELHRIAEPLIALVKKDSVANCRLAFNRTRSKAIIGKLSNDLGKRYVNRPGGYLRILECGFCTGDNASIVYAGLVDRSVGGEVVEATEQSIRRTRDRVQARFFYYLPQSSYLSTHCL